MVGTIFFSSLKYFKLFYFAHYIKANIELLQRTWIEKEWYYVIDIEDNVQEDLFSQGEFNEVVQNWLIA